MGLPCCYGPRHRASDRELQPLLLYMRVALALLIFAGVIFYLPRGKASAENLIPKRSFAQLGKTARTLKDQLR